MQLMRYSINGSRQASSVRRRHILYILAVGIHPSIHSFIRPSINPSIRTLICYIQGGPKNRIVDFIRT